MNRWNNTEILKLFLQKSIKSTIHSKILNKYDSYEQLLNAKNDFFLNYSIKQNELFASYSDIDKEAEKQIELCEKNKVQLVSIFDNNYPLLLKKITHPPILLFVKGELQPADSLAVAIVGTRRNTLYGKLMAQKFSEVLSAHKTIIVSGLANGIDTISQMQTVKSGGITYSVIASGIDKLSPHTARKNAEKIIDAGGAVISHYACGTTALPPYFLQRNRIIAGISTATLVIESDYKGGSLNTAKHCIQEGRELFAIPGNLTSAKSNGTNKLIRKNLAIPALSPEMLLEDIGVSTNGDNKLIKDDKIKFDDEREQKIYDTVNYEPLHVDDIADKSNLDISDVLVKLLELEFKGFVKQLPGKNYIRNI
jgi:DNA processing protein